jgi:hypothetical protein
MESKWKPAKFKPELKDTIFKSSKWYRCETVMDGNCALDALAVAFHQDRTPATWHTLRGVAMQNKNLSRREIKARQNVGSFLAFEDINFVAMSAFQTTPIIIDARDDSEYLFAFDPTTVREFAKAEEDLAKHAAKEGEERVYMILRYNETGNHFDTFGAKCKRTTIPKGAHPNLEFATLFKTSQLPDGLLEMWEEQRDLFKTKTLRSARQSRIDAQLLIAKKKVSPRVVTVISDTEEEEEDSSNETDVE